MSRRSLLGLVGTTSLAAGVVPAAAGTASAADRSTPARSGSVPAGLRPGGRYDRFVARQAADDHFSGTVLLARGGRTVLTRAYGMANKAASRPNKVDTLFNLGSVTKIFTALAVAQLVEQGKVACYERLGKYLDGFPAEIADVVTVHHLLTHTSGMGDYSTSPDFAAGLKEWDSADAFMDGTMDIIRKSPMQFTPGLKHSYSNSGFFVLGELVARVSGTSYFDYVRQHVFAPAGMARSDFYTKPQILAADDIAHPYQTRASGERIDFTTNEYFHFTGGPADGAYSTVSELLTYAQALQAGKLLGRPLVQLFSSGKVPLSPTDPPADPTPNRFYGYGHRNEIAGSQRVFGHSGSTNGGRTNFDIYPDSGWVAVVLGNYDDPVTPIVELERQLIAE